MWSRLEPTQYTWPLLLWACVSPCPTLAWFVYCTTSQAYFITLHFFSTPATTRSPVATAQVCPSGKVFQSCGTACPLTCENPNPRPCTRNCVIGCFCPPGQLESNGQCVIPTDCPGGEGNFQVLILTSLTAINFNFCFPAYYNVPLRITVIYSAVVHSMER